MAEALLSGNLEKFTSVLRDQQKDREEREAEKIRMLNADPFDPDVQAKIAEEIRLRNVETNMETAMEYAPESFGQVINASKPWDLGVQCCKYLDRSFVFEL